MKLLMIGPFGKFRPVGLFVALVFVAATGGVYAQEKTTLAEQNEILLQKLRQVHNLTDAQMAAIRKIFTRSGYIGQGNPDIAKHPATPKECREKLEKEAVNYENEDFRQFSMIDTWLPCTIPPLKTPKRPVPALTCSNFLTSRANIPWYGCVPEKQPRSARPWASACATPTNGRGPARALSKNRTTISRWPRVAAPTRP